jgi:uncharacterized protein YydD (DUF2326 family)
MKRFNIIFKNGLNIISADKTQKSTDKHSRNGAGKSTLLTLIDFCLAKDLTKNYNRILESKDFQKYTFILECHDNENNSFKIKRSIKQPENISF